jgi:uncharacterized membrane protein
MLEGMRQVHLSAHRAKLLRGLTQSLWLLPTLLALCGVALGLLLPRWDHALFGVTDADSPGPLTRFAPAPSPAESLMSTSAGALATILGVAFSLTVVTLQLATVQYTSRILRRFLADRLTQGVLGIFLGTIAFQLLVLRAIDPSAPGGGFVPPVSTLLVLMLVCLALLALFLHHLARSVQAATIIASVGKETIGALDRLGISAPGGEKTERPPPQGTPHVLTAATAGYLQLVDEEQLLSAAPADCIFLRVEARTGHFLLPGQPLATLWSKGTLDTKAVEGLRAAFAQGRERTIDQDILFGVRQLVDIALRALSPGVNDVTTALMVVNELGAVAHAVAFSHAGPTDGYRERQQGRVVVLLPRIGLRTLMENAFDEIPRAAATQPRVLARLVEVLTELAQLVHPGPLRDVIVEMGERVREVASHTQLSGSEWHRLDERLRILKRTRGGLHERPLNTM